MNDLLKERIRERALDARDWFEIRPDPHWWPAVAIPSALGVAYFVVPTNLYPFLLVGAAFLTAVMLVCGLLAGLAFVAGRAVRDFVDVRRSAQAESSTSAKPRWEKAYR